MGHTADMILESLFYIIFFFFSSRRRHTRFDCDWSSDVCSSDLSLLLLLSPQHNMIRDLIGLDVSRLLLPRVARSEERRVGEECRSRWLPDHLKKKNWMLGSCECMNQKHSVRSL